MKLRAHQLRSGAKPQGLTRPVHVLKPTPGLRASKRDTQQPLAAESQAEDVTRRQAVLGLIGLAAIAPAGQAAAKATKAPPAVDSVAVVQEILKRMPTGDVEGVLSKQAKEVVWKFPVAYPGDPLGGEFKGKYGVLTYLTRQTAQRSNVKLQDLKVTPGDGRDQVVARFRMSGKVASSNSKFSTSVTQVWRVSPDGLVASMTAYYDTTSLAKAAGIKAV